MTRAPTAQLDPRQASPTIADAFDALMSGRAQPEPPATDFGGPAIERRSISEQVANRILGMIKSGNLKSGDRLPTEQQMAIALGISRPPLREALKALTLMGVLESRQGGRYTVTDLSPSRLVARSTPCCRSTTTTSPSTTRRVPWSISPWSGSAASAPARRTAPASWNWRSTAGGWSPTPSRSA